MSTVKKTVRVELRVGGKTVALGMVTPDTATALTKVAQAMVGCPDKGEPEWTGRREQAWRKGWDGSQ